jgi:hypothetical protein
MNLEEAQVASRGSEHATEVLELTKAPKIKSQLIKISDNTLIEELREYCMWDLEEMMDRRDANERRIVWLAANQISGWDRIKSLML